MTQWGILGDGAIGRLIGARLNQSRESVNYVMTPKRAQGRSSITYKFIDTQGDSHCITAPIRTSAQHCDLLVVAVKAYQVTTALASVKLASNTEILTLQNGLGSQQSAVQIASGHQIWAGTTTHGALRHKNSVTHTGQGGIQLGPLAPSSPKAPPTWFDALNTAFAPVEYHQNIAPLLWRKLLINAMINPLTALDQIPNGALLEPSYQPLLRQLAEELAQVALACQQNFSASELLKWVREVCQKTAHNHSSMAEDCRHNRPTEIEFINGYIARQAQLAHVDTPINDYLYQQLS